MTTCSYIFFWVHFERNDVNLDQFYSRGISRSSSYHFSLNPFLPPLVGKPVDELWDQVLLNQLPSHPSLFGSINFPLYFFSVLVSVRGVFWLVHLQSENANPRSGSCDYRCLVSMECPKSMLSRLSLFWVFYIRIGGHNWVPVLQSITKPLKCHPQRASKDTSWLLHLSVPLLHHLWYHFPFG